MTTLMPVVFRKYPNGQIIALFPTLIEGAYSVTSYMHVGQHGGADYDGVVQTTKLATPEEYRDLMEELKNVGYSHMRVYRRFRPTY